MKDTILRGMAADNQVRFFSAYTKEVVETARSIHNTSPVATAALGRLLTAGAIMGSMCKNNSDVLTLQIQCSGPIGGLTVTANAATGADTSFKADFSFSDDPQVKGSWGSANKRFFVKADMIGESVGAQYTTTIGKIECDITISLRCNSTWAIGKRILKKAVQSLAGAANPYGGNGHLQNGLFYGVSPVTTAAGNVFPWTMQLK